jgi:uncharacterized membrane protein
MKKDNTVSKYRADLRRRSATAGPAAGSAARQARPSRQRDIVVTAATIGVVAAGIALFEVALLPGIAIGGAAVLAPKYVPKYLSGLRRRLRPLVNLAASRPTEFTRPGKPKVKTLLAAPARLGLKQAIVKTITFRMIVTSLDFTVNYVVLGEFATAAGLSAFALVAGPLFYLAHETAWNYFGTSDERVHLKIFLAVRPDAGRSLPAEKGFTISRPLAKTITFRTIATAMDFTTNFVVVGDLATAVALSASGFVLGPFVYLGHEMAWNYYGSSKERTPNPTPARLLPRPA